MAITGEIAQKAKERIPVTWAALIGDTARFGEPLMQGRIDSTKYRLFGSVVVPANEATTYSKLVIDYAGIMVALSLIPAGADYWASQSIQHTATDRNEQKSFLDRAAKLWELHEQLTKEAAVLWPDVEDETGPTPIKTRPRQVMAAADVGDGIQPHITPDPFAFERPFELPEVTA